MNDARDHLLLRAYLQTADRTPLTPTFERLLSAARKHPLAGCTVLKGLLGFGSHGIAQHSNWSLVEHLPMIVELLDSADKISEFLVRQVSTLLPHGTITLASVALAKPPVRNLSQAALSIPHAPRLADFPQLQTVPAMSVHEDGILLRVFLGESDKHEHRPLYEALVHKARELGLAGATVLRGVEGFGAHSVVHKAQLVDLSSDLPVVVEIMDGDARIREFLPHLEALLPEGTVTMEQVMIVKLGA